MSEWQNNRPCQRHDFRDWTARALLSPRAVVAGSQDRAASSLYFKSRGSLVHMVRFYDSDCLIVQRERRGNSSDDAGAPTAS